MPECILCGNQSFYGQDGLFYCEECNTQSQDVREEVEVEENFAEFQTSNAIRREVKAKAGRRGRKPKDPNRDLGKPWLTYEGYQCLIKSQMQALIKLGANPSLKDVIGQLWFRYLQIIGVAFTGASTIQMEMMKEKRDIEPGTADSPVPGKVPPCRRKQKQKEEIDDWDGEEFYDDDDPMKGRVYDDIDDLEESMERQFGRSENDDDEVIDEKDSYIGSLKMIQNKKEGLSSAKTRMTQHHTIAFVYLGLLCINEPISANDLIRWIKEGHIPYHKASLVFPAHMKFSRGDSRKFQLTYPLTAKRLHKCTRVIARDILKLPPIPKQDMNIIVAKVCLDLEISCPIHRLAIVVMETCGFTPATDFNKAMSCMCNPFYEEMAMAFIIVALKLVYGLDGYKERDNIISSAFLDIHKDNLEPWGTVALRLHRKAEERVRNSFPWREDQLPFVKDGAKYGVFSSKEYFKDWVANPALQKGYIHRASNRTSESCQRKYKDEYAEMFKQAGHDLSGRKEDIDIHIKPTSFPCSRIETDQLLHRDGPVEGQGSCAKDNLPQEALAKDNLPQEALAKDNLPQEALAKDNLPQGALAKDNLPQGALAKDNLPQEALAKDNLHQEALAKDNLPQEVFAKDNLPQGALAKDNQAIEPSDCEHYFVKGKNNEDIYMLYPDYSLDLNVHDSYKFLLRVCGDKLEVKPTDLQRFVEYVESALFEDSMYS